jgi:hypothetical protein
MGIVFARSADKHDIPNADALHAIQHAVYSSERVSGDESPRKRMVFIGPQHAQTERLIEVLVERRGGDFLVFHVMPLSGIYASRMKEDR